MTADMLHGMTSVIPDMPVPEVVAGFIAAGEVAEPVWLNEAGGVTYRLGNGPGARYVKWQPAHPEISLDREARKLEWANPYTPSPRVLAVGRTRDAAWLVTRSIPGSSAVAPRWLARPEVAVRTVGRGLRELHERLPADRCPWSWDPPARIAAATAEGMVVDRGLHEAPAVDRLVVCHGDACCPNTVLTDTSDVAGHVDFGSLGVADRWADIAVAAMSTRWNYGPGWEEHLVEAYGLAVDHERMEYYQRLWNAT